MRSLLIVYSYHHKNTEKIANAMAAVLDAEVRAPRQVNPDEPGQYELVGFGSGIYSDSPHPDLLDLADRLPAVTSGKAFIFSTMGAPFEGERGREYAAKCHARLRGTLLSKGYQVLGEFNCVGFNTNSFLKVLGGLNKDRPNAEDLRHAQEFAENLKQEVHRS